MDNQADHALEIRAANKCFLVYPGIEVSLLNETVLEDDHDRMASREEETGRWMLSYVNAGRLEITRGGRFAALGPGELMASRGRSVIETGFSPGGDLALLRISLNPDQARDALKGAGIQESFPSSLEGRLSLESPTLLFRTEGEQRELFESIGELARKGDLPRLRLRLLELLMKLPEAGNQLFEPESLTTGQHRYFRKALKIIESHPEEKLTIEEIASRVDCSPTTLKNAFRTMLGTSVHAYSRKVKIKTAMQLLRSLSISIAGAAQDVGFANAGKFSAAFRTETGKTPREWRSEMKMRENYQKRNP